MRSGDRLRYWFDNIMARGIAAQILLLAAVTVILVIVTAVATILFGVRPNDSAGHPDSFGLLVWKSLMHSLDSGTLSGDDAPWTFLFIMLFVTIGGLFVVSALIGILNQGFGDVLESLRRGRSVVVERGHTVILGWNSKIYSLLYELAEANRNQKNACVVILADRDKVAMDEEISSALRGSKLRVVTRRGSALTIDDLRLVALNASKAVIVLSPELHPDGSPVSATEADAVVLKALLAIKKVAADAPLHIVAEILDPRTEPVARMVTGDQAALIATGPLVSRLLVQTGRQSGLSAVYSELLDFAGVEIYVQAEPQLVGETFRDATFRYGSSTLIGVLTADGELQVPPALDRRFETGDQVVAISEDDDRVLLDGSTSPDQTLVVERPAGRAESSERTLVLGTSPRLPLVLRELDSYVGGGSETLMVGEGDPGALVSGLNGTLKHMVVTAQSGDVTDRDVLESLDIAAFDHVLVLSETIGRSQEMADARTTVVLLYLRAITQNTRKVPVTSEILDIRNRDLTTSGEADDFIVSNRLVSLVLSQVAENRHLVRVFDELLGADGHELYIRPATDYVRPGEVTFATVSEAALRRNEIAVGYRLAAAAADAENAFGVVVNPAKGDRICLGVEDKVIVLAED